LKGRGWMRACRVARCRSSRRAAVP
jgi:hypothetical protein